MDATRADSSPSSSVRELPPAALEAAPCGVDIAAERPQGGVSNSSPSAPKRLRSEASSSSLADAPAMVPEKRRHPQLIWQRSLSNWHVCSPKCRLCEKELQGRRPHGLQRPQPHDRSRRPRHQLEIRVRLSAPPLAMTWAPWRWAGPSRCGATAGVLAPASMKL